MKAEGSTWSSRIWAALWGSSNYLKFLSLAMSNYLGFECVVVREEVSMRKGKQMGTDARPESNTGTVYLEDFP